MRKIIHSKLYSNTNHFARTKSFVSKLSNVKVDSRIEARIRDQNAIFRFSSLQREDATCAGVNIKWNRLQSESRKSSYLILHSILYPNNANNELLMSRCVNISVCNIISVNNVFSIVTFWLSIILFFKFFSFLQFNVRVSVMQIRVNRRYSEYAIIASFSFTSNHFLLWNATTRNLRAHHCSWLSVARYGNSEGRTNRSKWYYFLFAFIWMNQTDRFIRSHLVFVSRIEGTWEINRSTGKYISFFFLPLWQCDENINILRI